jgi:hypothetical protein
MTGSIVDSKSLLTEEKLDEVGAGLMTSPGKSVF